tara:strand:+ start:4216 stop:4923 length:708 start_codon:yes stop_codon:yes gene_type:complete
MVSINDVRETVLAICNKNNYGYISPDDFNLYAKQAQLDVFNGYMSKYNYYMNMQNQHQSGSDFANLAESTREAIEMFIETENLTLVSTNLVVSIFNLPLDWYHIEIIGYIGGPKVVDVEKTSRSSALRLSNSSLTAPTIEYPIYNVTSGNVIEVRPPAIQADVYSSYVRYPIDPIWSYVTLTNGEPMYNAGSSVDFEVAEDEESMLVDKILEKAGLSIREQEVYKTAQSNDNQQQ